MNQRIGVRKLILEQKLELLGIPSLHIQWLKATNLESKPSDYLIIEDNEKQIIPVSKIVGLDLRGNPEHSWWSHFSQDKGNLPRLGFLIKRMVILGLDDFKATYMMEEFAQDLDLLYFPAFDFYIGTNGSHRITMAKVTNVEYMIGNVTVTKEKL